jgi:fructose-1,6-bisphosphatase/inositol monophosphatase family enzyme
MRRAESCDAAEAFFTLPPLPALVDAPALRPEIEVLYRVSVAVHRVFRDAATSPHRGDQVAMGADGSPTEHIDRLAESEILRVLDVEGVDWNLISEEIGQVDRGGSRTLVADPIDGSHNVLRNLPFSSVSLALGSQNLEGIDFGLVRDLDRGTTYWAARGGGAWRDGRPLRVRPWAARNEVLFVNLGAHASENALRFARQGRRVRSLGCASLEMLAVAGGGADGYFFDNTPARHNLRATDIAGAYRILAEAGGGVWDSAGKELGPFPLTVAERTSVFAWGDRAFADAVTTGGFP